MNNILVIELYYCIALESELAIQMIKNRVIPISKYLIKSMKNRLCFLKIPKQGMLNDMYF